MIMDGKPLPSKADTEQERRENRKTYFERAEKYLKEGDKMMAFRYFGLSCDVGVNMANDFIQEFKKEGIEVIIAPYEADS